MPYHHHVIIAWNIGHGSNGAVKQALDLSTLFGLNIDAVVLHLDAFQHGMRMFAETIRDQSFAHRPGQFSLVGRKLIIECFGFGC